MITSVDYPKLYIRLPSIWAYSNKAAAILDFQSRGSGPEKKRRTNEMKERETFVRFWVGSYSHPQQHIRNERPKQPDGIPHFPSCQTRSGHSDIASSNGKRSQQSNVVGTCRQRFPQTHERGSSRPECRGPSHLERSPPGDA